MGKLRDKVIGVQPVILRRNEPVHPPAHYAQETDFYQPAVQYEEAPRPVPDSSFAGQGRDPQHSPTPIARFEYLAISDILSHAAWPFSIRTEPGAVVVGQPHGAFNPIRERVTISMPPQGILSDMTTLEGQVLTTAPLAKITL